MAFLDLSHELHSSLVVELYQSTIQSTDDDRNDNNRIKRSHLGFFLYWLQTRSMRDAGEVICCTAPMPPPLYRWSPLHQQENLLKWVLCSSQWWSVWLVFCSWHTSELKWLKEPIYRLMSNSPDSWTKEVCLNLTSLSLISIECSPPFSWRWCVVDFQPFGGALAVGRLLAIGNLLFFEFVDKWTSFWCIDAFVSSIQLRHRCEAIVGCDVVRQHRWLYRHFRLLSHTGLVLPFDAITTRPHYPSFSSFYTNDWFDDDVQQVDKLLYMITIGYGIAMSSMFPTTISFIESMVEVGGKEAAVFIVAASIGKNITISTDQITYCPLEGIPSLTLSVSW